MLKFPKIESEILFGAAAVIALYLTVFSTPVFAQQSAPARSVTDAQIEERVPRGAERPTPPPTSPAGPLAAPEQPDKARTFLVAAVTLEGNTVFRKPELAPYYEDILARLVTAADLQAAAERITRHYQDRGYFLTQAYLPPQDLSSGIARIRIAEGYVERVDFHGDGRTDGYIQRLASAIDEFRPLKRSDLERMLLLIGDSYGRIVDNAEMAEIDPLEGRYALQLILKDKPESGVLVLDNRGTTTSGKEQLWISASTNRLFGPDTQSRIGFFTIPMQPQELRYGEFEVSRMTGDHGTTVGALISASQSDAGGIDAIDGIEGDSDRIVLKAAHPLIRSMDRSLWLNLSADARNVSEDDNDGRNFKDQLRVLRGDLYMYLADDFGGQNQIWTEVSTGLDMLGASGKGDFRSRLGADAKFLKARASLTRQQEITNEIGVRFHLAGQYADDQLLSSEEFSLGGSSIGRAYDFSELTGDHGVGGSVELQYGDSLRDDYFTWFQVYGFYDAGVVWNEGAFELPHESLSSAGFGLRLDLTDSIRLQLEYARGLTRSVDDSGGDFQRVFFELSKNF